jgi:uncharacterized membrane protein
MFAFFNIGLTELVVLGLFGLAILGGGAVILVVWLLVRPKGPIEPDDGASPLERARAAAAALTPQEREALRRSLEEPRPPAPGGGGGVTS